MCVCSRVRLHVSSHRLSPIIQPQPSVSEQAGEGPNSLSVSLSQSGSFLTDITAQDFSPAVSLLRSG